MCHNRWTKGINILLVKISLWLIALSKWNNCTANRSGSQGQHVTLSVYFIWSCDSSIVDHSWGAFSQDKHYQFQFVVKTSQWMCISWKLHGGCHIVLHMKAAICCILNALTLMADLLMACAYVVKDFNPSQLHYCSSHCYTLLKIGQHLTE